MFGLDFKPSFSTMPWNWLVSAAVTTDTDQKPQTQDVTQRQDFYGMLAQQGLFPYQMGPVVGYSPLSIAGWPAYRMMMRTWPTLSLAYCMKQASVISGAYTIESDPDGKEEAKQLIEKIFLDKSTLIPLLQKLYKSRVLRNAPISIVYGLNEVNGVTYQVPRLFKALLPEFTQILIDEPGEIVGIRNGGIDLTGPNYLLGVNEPETMPIYGWSLLENVREQWWQWLEGRQRAGQLNEKAAGKVFVVLGPDGSVEYTDAKGKAHKASTLAARLADKLQKGIGDYLPNKMTTMRAGNPADLAKLAETSDFKVTYYDLGNVGPAQAALLSDLEYLDKLGFRGLYLPERSGMEGQHGTKAEASVHSDIVQDQCDLDRLNMATTIQQAIDWTLEINFGVNERGKHKLTPAPVVDKTIAFLQDTAKLLIQNGQAGVVSRMMAMSGFFDKVGWPINEKMESDIDDPEEWTPEPPPEPGVNGKKPMNGEDDDSTTLSRLSGWLGER